MATWNLGSFADEILQIIPDVPSNVSGALLDIVDRSRLYVECYTGKSIGSVAIAEKYQPAILAHATFKALGTMQLTGADVESIKLGDWQQKKGGNSNLSKSMEAYELEYKEALKCLGFGTRMYKANG